MIAEATIKNRRVESFTEVLTENYAVRIAQNEKDIESALRLRHDVFNVEMGASINKSGIESDDFDSICQHLIVVERKTQKTVGTYRLNTLEYAGKVSGFYSYSEFRIEDLPFDILSQGVEIGRACIARDHRNTKVLFLLWKGLANYLRAKNKRYFFGCTSIFSIDPKVGDSAFQQLKLEGVLHQRISIQPRIVSFRKNLQLINWTNSEDVELPNLFRMYLKIGARICGEPTIDYDFKTTDFFVLFDAENINEKYRKMFFPL